MTKKLHTSEASLVGTAQLPASKSISNRALIINALNDFQCQIENLSTCDDTRFLQQALSVKSTKINIGAAGTAMRFLTAFLATQNGTHELTGSARLCQRPIKSLVDALQTLGADISYLENDGHLPLRIVGKNLQGGELTPHFAESSQFFSALMLIAPRLQHGLTLHLNQKPTSFAYICMTAELMRHFGIDVQLHDDKIVVPEGVYRPTNLMVENDWSAASYWYELLTIGERGKIILPNLAENSLQGDAKIAELFENFGVKTTFLENAVEIKFVGSELQKKLEFDFSDMPDMAQTFVVTCCAKGVPFRFSGLKTLKVKETDRIAALISELRKCGFMLTEPSEGVLAWNGERCKKDKNVIISTFDDHRMAMAFAPLALLQPLEIENPEVVTKSYPEFWQEFDKITKNNNEI